MSYNSTQYDKSYYESHCGNCYERGHGWEEVFARQASYIVKELQPCRVLDVGCAVGYLVEGLRDLGVEAYGIDISDYAISQVREDIKPYCKVQSATDTIDERYDLITCIEVVEHLEPRDYKTAIENMCKATDTIIFSSTPFDFKEESHISVNSVSFWVEQFAYNGFYHDISYDCSYIAVQTMLFRKGEKARSELIREYENRLFDIWNENCVLRSVVNPSNENVAEGTIESRLYFDAGDGISELNKYTVKSTLISKDTFQCAEEILVRHDAIKTFRYDMLEGRSCYVETLCVQVKDKDGIETGRYEMEKPVFLKGNDPYIYLPLEAHRGECVCIQCVFIVEGSIVLDKLADLIDDFQAMQGYYSENIDGQEFKNYPEQLMGAVYYDRGEGYSEEDMEHMMAESVGNGKYRFMHHIDKLENVVALRYDPVEGKNCIVTYGSITQGEKELDIYYSPNILGNNGRLLLGDDPMIMADVPCEFPSVVVEIEFLIEGKDFIEEIIWNLKNKKKECETYQRKAEVLTHKNEENEIAIKEKNNQIKNYEKQLEKQLEKLLSVIQLHSDTCKQLIDREERLRVTFTNILIQKNTISDLGKQLGDMQYLYGDACRQSMDNYSNLVEALQSAEYWESRVRRMQMTKSWKLTEPLRIPGHIYSKLKSRKENKRNANTCNYDIKFSIIMPVYNVDIKWLKLAINSVQNQTYKNWELCIADDASTDANVIEYLKKIQNPKIKIKFLPQNGGISAASNSAARMAMGEYILLMDNDDEISPDALGKFYNCIKNTAADIVYSDQDIIDINGNHSCPLYKPDWSPDLFLSQMYLGHLIGFKRELFDKVGGFRTEFDGSQDYDLLLRITEHTDKIEHITSVLYSWRAVESSTAANPAAKPYAQYAGLHAIQEHLYRTLGEKNAKVEETDELFVYDVQYSLPPETSISIIIPTKDHAEDLRIVIDSIFERSSYRNFEIIVLNNNSEEDETYQYFHEVEENYVNVRIADAFFDFNWSKLNNYGISIAKGDVYLFLNNDVRILTTDWLERLAAQALRSTVGMVGAMLLYEDGTIQHGGVVIGFGGYADHVYKGTLPVHSGTPFISPVVTRNVSAVTGACMAVSRKTIEKIGLFNEEFVICGSDVEICIRAMEHGLTNIYEPHVRLYHYESKSRGTFVPQIDFVLSKKFYAPFIKNGDLYYNLNLDYNSFIPKVKGESENTEEADAFMDVEFPEVTPIRFRKVHIQNKRLNILLPSLNSEDLFGGISTALKFFDALQKVLDVDCRILITDAIPNTDTVEKYGWEYMFVECENDIEAHKLIVPISNRAGRRLPVSENDIFIFTGWWTAYCIQQEYVEWENNGLNPRPFIYLIQDYEPGFYQWSSLYMLADSTYRTRFDQIAVFNSSQLKEYFDFLGYEFSKSFVFEPVLNDTLKKHLLQMDNNVVKKKQILVYGRPNTSRNAFGLVVEALRKWVEMQDDVKSWRILSAGEGHKKVDLGNGMVLESVGKLPIEDYAKTLQETYAGISLMVSPHPSYPPLEMAVFGVRVITNTYANKDLSKFNENIISLRYASPDSIAKELWKICREYTSKKRIDIDANHSYCFEDDIFPFINEIKKYYE